MNDMRIASDERRVCRVIGNWFVVTTEWNQDRLAAKSIGALGLPVYRPMIDEYVPHGRGQVRWVERSMFPGYVFVHCHPIPECLGRIMVTRGVAGMIDAPIGEDVRKPLAVPDGAIEAVRLFEGRKRSESEARKRRQNGGIVWTFAPGDVVRITHGPFAGFNAALESAADAHDRLEALVAIFGRPTKTELSALDVEPL